MRSFWILLGPLPAALLGLLSACSSETPAATDCIHSFDGLRDYCDIAGEVSVSSFASDHDDEGPTTFGVAYRDRLENADDYLGGCRLLLMVSTEPRRYLLAELDRYRSEAAAKTIFQAFVFNYDQARRRQGRLPADMVAYRKVDPPAPGSDTRARRDLRRNGHRVASALQATGSGQPFVCAPERIDSFLQSLD